ncbi:hypothetical protein TNCV_5076841 [Trichonephila clavipes]|uniref:Uncharacterized protein n=1 Tax=Trichonephila clavipes TaxID=2585209 RepID=A0A8X6RT01_TRICX|nr:hypothetical protein TNCV_5076841 [Trichonephila clavipes]
MMALNSCLASSGLPPLGMVWKLGERVPAHRCRPCHLTMVQNDEVRRQKPSCDVNIPSHSLVENSNPGTSVCRRADVD